MEKIALITDSTSDITDEMIQKYNINVLPFRIIYKDREYLDRENITPEEVYESLETEVPTSSLPPLNKMHELFESLQEEGYTHVVAILLSSGLSGISNAMTLVSEDYPQIKSFIYDSKSISWGEGILVAHAGEMIAQNKPFDSIVSEIKSTKERIEVFFVVDTLEYLKRGGRIGKVSGAIGELLKIKPIISIAPDGKYFTVDKARGRKQSHKKIVEIAKDKLSNDARIILMDGYAKAETKKIYDLLSDYSKNLGKGSTELYGTISPVSGVHSGPGLVGLVVLNNE